MSLISNVKEKADLIWAIADKLTGIYKPHEYGRVILPLTVIRRFDCVLAETKEKVLEVNQKNLPAPFKERALIKAAGYNFYNVSPFTLQKIVDDADSVTANFRNYLNGFSKNIRGIIQKFNFDSEIERMDAKKILYIVLKEFTTANADFHPAKISNIEMGYVFEEIIRRFSEAYNEDAGQHYTPREVIKLMVNLIFMGDEKIFAARDTIKTIYDPACGTGGMLSVAKETIAEINPSVELVTFGQEINDETFAICQADTLIKGDDAENIRAGNTLSDDKFPADTYDYILSNPPFGREWKNEEAAVKAESKKGYAGRFGAGLPALNDSQFLFLQTALAKMKSQGTRIAIIHNGSALFTGDAGSGTSEIRRYILEHDLLEAIVALPNDIFYNTGIATYIWLLTNKKNPARRGKVQLINANDIFTKMRKSLGSKRNEISTAQISEIVKLYTDFKENERCKIFDNADFGYRKIIIERPLKDDAGNLILKNGKRQPNPALRDTENVPLKENLEDYFAREILPFAPDAWIDNKKILIGYEIPFTRYFYKYAPPASTNSLAQDCRALAAEINAALKKVLAMIMKDSGLEWLGNIPAHWKIIKLKYLFEIFSGTTPKSDKEIYWEGNIVWITPADFKTENKFIEKGHRYLTEIGVKNYGLRLIPPNSLIFSKRAPIGEVVISNTELTINQGCLACIPRKDCHTTFYYYLLSVLTELFNIFGAGTTFKEISLNKFANFYVLLPPLEEQQKIAAYLDKKCAAIDRAVDAAKKLVVKFGEYKKSLITETVTKGLDAAAPLQESNIEWLGNIPAHWKIIKLKYLFSFDKGLPITKENLTENGVPVISYGQIHSKNNTGTAVKEDLIKFVPATYLKTNKNSLVNEFDFIFADTSEDFEGCGNCVYIDKQLELFAGYHSIILRSIEKTDKKYLAYLFFTDCWRYQIRSRVTGVKVFSITKKILNQVSVILPPLEEQQEIASYLDKKCAAIDESIFKYQQLAEKLAAYKKSLIYEVVTGKIEV